MKKLNGIQLEKIFKIIYLLHLLCAFNAIINQTAIMKVTLVSTVVIGAIVAFMKLKDCSLYFKYVNFWGLNIFLVSYVISSTLNIKYGYMDNIQGFVWLGAQIWILYLINYDLDIAGIKKEFALIGKIFVSWVTVSNLISLVMFFVRFSKRIIDDGVVKKTYGFLWGRLWGIYDDPNHGAIIAMCAVVLAIYLYHLYISKKTRVLLVGSIVIQSLYIIMSDSRTGILCIAFGIAIIVAVCTYWKKQNKKIINATIVFLVSIIIVLAIEVPVQKGMSIIGSYTVRLVHSSDEMVDEQEGIEVGRDELTSDPSNRRFDIWGSGIELFKTSPVFGISRYNFINYAKSEVPDAYIINNDLQKFDSMHNMPLDVLVSQGFVGILILLIVVMYSIWHMKCNYKVIRKENYMIMLILFVLLVINAMSSMFISTVIYINSPATFVFWISFGYFFRILQPEKAM